MAQVLTMVLAAVVIVWHQQRTSDKIRAEFRTEIARLDARIDQMRVEFDKKLELLDAKLDLVRAEVAVSGQRLARIEGFLGIGIPEEVAGAAAGARFAPRLLPAPTSADPTPDGS